MIIIWIQNLYYISGKILLFYCLLIIPFIKGIQLEALYRLCIPDTKRVNNTVAIAHNGKIIGNRPYALVSLLNKMVSAVFIYSHIYITAKFYFLGIFRSSQFKRISIRKPVIRNLYLITVPDLLFEHTVTITNATAISSIA